jgi:hypothetical protein
MHNAYLVLASSPDSLLRMHVYHTAIDADAGDTVTWRNPSMVRKNGINLWADGSYLAFLRLAISS